MDLSMFRFSPWRFVTFYVPFLSIPRHPFNTFSLFIKKFFKLPAACGFPSEIVFRFALDAPDRRFRLRRIFSAALTRRAGGNSFHHARFPHQRGRRLYSGAACNFPHSRSVQNINQHFMNYFTGRRFPHRGILTGGNSFHHVRLSFYFFYPSGRGI